MGRTACTEPQCLHKGALYLTLPKNLDQLWGSHTFLFIRYWGGYPFNAANACGPRIKNESSYTNPTTTTTTTSMKTTGIISRHVTLRYVWITHNDRSVSLKIGYKFEFYVNMVRRGKHTGVLISP